MKLTDKQADKIAEFIAVFLINGFVFGISALLTNLDFPIVMLYSLINSIWMTFLLIPFITRIITLFKRK